MFDATPRRARGIDIVLADRRAPADQLHLMEELRRSDVSTRLNLAPHETLLVLDIIRV
jgi:signal recognition particle GTPase